MKTWLTKTFDLDLPIIMAPMFLVSNEEMVIAAAKAGIMGSIPSLNYRTPELFEQGLKNLKANLPEGTHFGINLIVNKSNVHLESHLEILSQYPASFIITSLGSPEKCIKMLQPKGSRIFCDVVDDEYAAKVTKMGCDALIAVNSGAGGHAGSIPMTVLLPMLRKHGLPVINAGGIGNGAGLLAAHLLGAEGCSIGSPFIATKECKVSEGYKEACRDYGANDIGMTTKLSGTPCTVIKTPYVKKIGLEQNPVESFLNKNRQFKKYAKMLTFYKGMKLLEKAAFSATYKSVWCAGPSIEFTDKIDTVSDIVSRYKEEVAESLALMKQV